MLYFPTVAAPITLSYNLSGVAKLTLTAPTTAKIFAGTITTWNDPAIAADNPGVTLPSHQDHAGAPLRLLGNDQQLHPVPDQGGAGRLETFGTGKTVGLDHRLDRQRQRRSGPERSSRPTGPSATSTTPTPRPAGFTLASVKNSSGKVLAPTLEGASAAVAAATVNADLTYDPTNASAPDAYPITSPTWIVIYKQQSDQNKGAALKAFLGFILTIGQKSMATRHRLRPAVP